MTLFLAATAMLNLQLTQNQCTLKTVLKNSSGKTYEIAKPSSSLGASWVYRNTVYVLQSYKVEKGEPGSVPFLIQTMSTPLQSKGTQRTQERTVSFSLKAKRQIEQNVRERIVEAETLSPEKKQIFEILPNGQRNLLSTDFEETDGDLTKRHTVLNPDPKEEKDGFRAVSSEQQCSTSMIAEPALHSDAVLKKAVDTFSAYLKSTKLAEAALQSCLKQHRGDCTEQVLALKQKLAGIAPTWNGLITAGQLEHVARK